MKTFLKIDLSVQIFFITTFFIGWFFPQSEQIFDINLCQASFVLGMLWMFFSILIAAEQSSKNPRLKLLGILFFGSLFSISSLFILGYFGFVFIGVMGLLIPILVLFNLIFTYQAITEIVDLIQLPKSFEEILDSEEILNINL